MRDERAVAQGENLGVNQLFIRKADEVKVFETFGGDLPVLQANRKPLRKTAGRPVIQSCGRLIMIRIHYSRMSKMPPVGWARAEGLHYPQQLRLICDNFILPVPRNGGIR
ncbi:hypothetical protein AB4Z29_24820 [Paenibacillus sp. 2TAB23]|uniref:hypothetical protein n=1 Tax=Paenibacillus sp. 2TAB23 TaxID=3233004 RepID=UPI003F9D254C